MTNVFVAGNSRLSNFAFTLFFFITFVHRIFLVFTQSNRGKNVSTNTICTKTVINLLEKCTATHSIFMVFKIILKREFKMIIIIIIYIVACDKGDCSER